jgi:hypothetical protein
MSVSQIRAQLARIEKTVPGVKSASAYPPDAAVAALPYFFNRMDSGEFTTPRMMGWRETVHILKAVCLVQYAGELADAERKIENIVYEFTNTLDHAKTLGDTERVLDADVLRYEAGPYSLPNQ